MYEQKIQKLKERLERKMRESEILEENKQRNSITKKMIVYIFVFFLIGHFI